MKLSELLSQLREDGLFPIRVESIPESRNDLVFTGSLGEFIQAAKAIQSPVIFVSAIILSEEHFLGNNLDIDDENDDDEYIDLCKVVPELENLKSRIGEDGQIELSVPGPIGSLTLAIVEEWMVTFAELHSQALQLLRQEVIETRAQETEVEDVRTQHLLRNLRGLITDKDFVRLPTQRAMLAYALDDFPELEILGENVLRVEIQNLKAKIDAQGLRRK